MYLTIIKSNLNVSSSDLNCNILVKQISSIVFEYIHFEVYCPFSVIGYNTWRYDQDGMLLFIHMYTICIYYNSIKSVAK